MSLRTEDQGLSIYPDCLKLSVAAITYPPFESTDLSQVEPGERKALLQRLKGTGPRASLRRLAYEMNPGDVIYVKEEKKIIDKGTVTRSYRFNLQNRLGEGSGLVWPHQVAVAWSSNFNPVDSPLVRDRLAVKKLTCDDVERIERASADVKGEIQSRELLLENSYYRESPARLKVIIPQHNILSNEFCGWLKRFHGIGAIQEKQRVDVRFTLGDRAVISELKVCFGAGTTRSIREALGQLLEYNHYPARKSAETWLIVIDEEPSQEDKRFIQTLRDSRALPVSVGWRVQNNFKFHPPWP